jgi:hypothetical protein
MSKAATVCSTLDPSKIVDNSLTSDDLRQKMLCGVAESWGVREPFYVLDRASFK